MSDRNKIREGEGKSGKKGVSFDGGDDAVPSAAFRKKRQSPGADRENPLASIDSGHTLDISDMESEVERLSKKMGTKFLSEEEREDFLSGVGELRHVESVIHNSNEDGRVARKNEKKKSPVWESKLNTLKQERKTLVESLKERERAIRSTLEKALSGVQSELGRLKGLPGFETDPKYPEHLADLKGIEDAIGALDDFIRKRGKQRGGANKKRSESNNPVTPGDARNPDSPNPDNRDVTPEPIPEKNPVPDDRVGKKENAMDRSLLETSIRSIESRLKDLGKERLEAEESLRRVSAYPEHMKGLKASLGFFLKSNEEILGKLRAEEAVFQKRLEVLDEGILREERALSTLRTQLEAMDAPVASVVEPVIRTPSASTKEATSVPKVDVLKGVAEKEKEAVRVDVSVDVSRRFYEQFKINKSDLLLLEGFSDLKEEQQLFVAEMLRQTAARKIEDRARDAVATKSGLLKGYHLAVSRKDAAGQVLHGGMKTYGEDLRQLVDWMKVSGLDVEEKGGKFGIRFLSIPEGQENENLLVSESASFNEAANRFSTIPHEWSLPGASKDERKRYKEAKSAYDEAYARLDGIVNRDRGLEDPKAYATLREENVALRIADNRVRLIQHLTAHPEVGKQLEKFEQQNAFLAGMKSVVAERGAYAVFGAAGRFLLGATPLGLLAAPAVASISGAITARIRSGESLIEQDRQARRGKDSARVPSNTSRAFVLATGDSKRKGLVERLDLIVSKTLDFSDSDEGARDKAVEALQARIAYTWKKIDSGLVNFGTEGVIGNQVRLEEALSNAEMTLSLVSGGAASEQRRERLLSGQDGLQERMNRVLDSNERKVASERSRFKNAETVKGAVISGTISLLGAGFIHKAMEWFHEVADSVEMPVNGSVNASGVLEHRDAVPEAMRTRPGFTSGRGVVPEASTGNAPAEAGMPRPVQSANDTASGVNAPKGAGTVTETAKQVIAERTSETSVSTGNTYLETAKSGDSVTTLARRALAGYVKESNLSGLTPEQKVFIEDYLQKKIARGSTLRVGEKVGFTRELLNEAFGKAKALDANQLQNLHRYAEDVKEFRTGSGPAHVDAPTNEVPAPASSNADIPKGPLAPVVEDRVPSPKDVPTESVDSSGGRIPTEKIADSAMETKVPAGSLSDMMRSEEARSYLADPRHAEPFLKVMKSVSAGLFSKEGVPGEIDEKAMRQIGDMPSKEVFKSCFVSIADSGRSGAVTAAESEKLRRFGKFLLAARKYGIAPELDSGKGETFRAYMERVSVALAKNGKPASILLDSGLKDAELDERAAAAAAALRSRE